MTAPLLHLTSAALLPPIDHAPGRFVQRLAAMARPPHWVIDITSGRPRHAFAVGFEVDLMHAAIAERANPLLSQGGRAWAAYAAALDERWKVLAAAGEFAPGAWVFDQYVSPYRPDGYKGFPQARDGGHVREVPAECYVVCTCRPHEGCHLRLLAPHLVAAGWSVQLYGEALS